jgi:hypothetical protein
VSGSKKPHPERIARNLHQIYDTLIYQARQMFRGFFSEKNFRKNTKMCDAGNYAIYPAILRLKKCKRRIL